MIRPRLHSQSLPMKIDRFFPMTEPCQDRSQAANDGGVTWLQARGSATCNQGVLFQP